VRRGGIDILANKYENVNLENFYFLNLPAPVDETVDIREQVSFLFLHT